MDYKRKPGITMIQVCGQHMLVASRSVWGEVSRIRPISRVWAVCWQLMDGDKTSKDVVRVFADLFKKPEGEICERFDKIFTSLFEEGYLIPAEENSHDAG